MKIAQTDLNSLIETIQARQGASAEYHEGRQSAIVVIDDCYADNWGMYATIKKTMQLSSGTDEFGDQWQISAAWRSFCFNDMEWCASMVGGWRIRFI